METNFDIKDAIMKRYSCRTFEKRPIDPKTLEEFTSWIAELDGAPFGTEIRFTVAASAPGDSESLRGLGTYGFIRNPAGFVIGAMKKGNRDLEDYGYLMEMITLKAASLGLASCWLGGSFTKSSFARRIDAAVDETVPAVLAIGYAAEKKRFVERLARWKMDADNRKPWEDIFFDGAFSKSLAREEAGFRAGALELLRMAPSAVNYQPWRVIKSGNDFHFFLERTKNYDENSFMLKSDLQRIDMGIAMSHFEAGVSLENLPGAWSLEDAAPAADTGHRIYTATWKG